MRPDAAVTSTAASGTDGALGRNVYTAEGFPGPSLTPPPAGNPIGGQGTL